MSRAQIAGLCCVALALLYFHQVMPWYEFWPLAALLALPAALLCVATAMSRLTRVLAASRGPRRVLHKSEGNDDAPRGA